VTENQQGIFGIDLGTTYSVVGYVDEAGRPSVTRNSAGADTTPSVVYFESPTSVVVGQSAKEAAGQDPDNVVALIKREMGNKDYRRTCHGTEHTPPSISAIILEALATDAEADLGRRVDRAVITVPAYFGLLERDATRQAGEIAGLDVIGIVPEPVAAALHYGITGSADGTTILVFDLGGGTFDVSLMRMTEDRIEVVATGGDHHLGGADWDEKLLAHLVDEVTAQVGDDTIRDDEALLQTFRLLAERTKRDLTAMETKKLVIREAGKPVTLSVTRDEFEQLTAELLEETVRITRRTLEAAEDASPGSTRTIDEVLLVGGASRMPAVAEILRKEFGWEPKLTDPDLAVAKGAALYAAGRAVKIWEAEHGDDPSAGDTTGAAVAAIAAATGIPSDRLGRIAARETVNVIPKAIGVKLVDSTVPGWPDHPRAHYVEHLVEANTQLPYTADTLHAGTVEDNQEIVEIELWEQAGAVKSRDLGENHLVDNGAKCIEGIPPLPAGSAIDVDLTVDNEGTVSVRAIEPVSGRDLTFSVRISIMTTEQVAQAKQVQGGLTISSY
jgi:molecular chaperone DnaK (HSP70)